MRITKHVRTRLIGSFFQKYPKRLPAETSEDIYDSGWIGGFKEAIEIVFGNVVTDKISREAYRQLGKLSK
jgi:hypothetical protein